MSLVDAEYDDATVEQCIDEVNDCLERLARHSPIALAMTLHIHLEALLQSLLDGDLCTREELRELWREVLEHDEVGATPLH